MTQVILVSYGTKSRSWFVRNPIAAAVEKIDPARFWKWDIGRTVQTEGHAIPLFGLDTANEHCRADKMTIYGMFGEGRIAQAIVVL